MSEPGAARREYEEQLKAHGWAHFNDLIDLADAALAVAAQTIEELTEACNGQWKMTVRQRERAEQAESEVERLKEQWQYVRDRMPREWAEQMDYLQDELWAERGGGK